MAINICFILLIALIIVITMFYSHGKRKGKQNAIQESFNKSVKVAQDVIVSNENNRNVNSSTIDDQLRVFKREDN
jgi:hypothetical protein